MFEDSEPFCSTSTFKPNLFLNSSCCSLGCNFFRLSFLVHGPLAATKIVLSMQYEFSPHM